MDKLIFILPIGTSKPICQKSDGDWRLLKTAMWTTTTNENNILYCTELEGKFDIMMFWTLACGNFPQLNRFDLFFLSMPLLNLYINKAQIVY